jgi:hypothetical protein
MKISKRADDKSTLNSSYDDIFSQVKNDWSEACLLLDGNYNQDKKSFVSWINGQENYVNIHSWKAEYIKNILHILSKENFNKIDQNIFKKISLGHSIFIGWWEKNYLLINNSNDSLLKSLDSFSISIGLDSGFWTNKSLFLKIYKDIISYFGDKIVEEKYQVNIDDKINIDKIIEESKEILEQKKEEISENEVEKEKNITPAIPPKPPEISKRLELKSNFSDSFFGGKQPRWLNDWGLRKGETLHGGRSRGNWMSDRAWDVGQDPGTPIYSLTSGVVSNTIQYDGSKDPKVFGFSFMVIGSDGYPDIWYTHTENPSVKNGDIISVGQKIAEVTTWKLYPKNSHVHIGLESGYISDLMEESGKIKKTKQLS